MFRPTGKTKRTFGDTNRVLRKATTAHKPRAGVQTQWGGKEANELILQTKQENNQQQQQQQLKRGEKIGFGTDLVSECKPEAGPSWSSVGETQPRVRHTAR